MRQSKQKRKGRKACLSSVHPDAAGIEVGSRFHGVAVPSGRDQEPVRIFESFAGELHQMADWLLDCGIKTVAMESTGIDWGALYEVLESRGIDVVVVTVREVNQVPGRKTEVNDAQGLQQLHEDGLVRGSFHPPADIA